MFQLHKMNSQEFRVKGKELIDYIADYLENIRERRVFPDKKPGYIWSEVAGEAPADGEPWCDIFADVERVVMPGVTHWQSPHMHAYFPALTSYPSMLAEMITNAVNCLGFTWASSPACTELEMVVMNWLAKMIGLPDEFLHRKDGDGGGVIQTTASECTLISLLAGRFVALKMYEDLYPEASKHEINGKLVAYCSDQAHSSVEKAALIGLVRLHYVESDRDFSMTGAKLREAVIEDRENGLIPFWVCATLGTTGSCAFDRLSDVGAVCREELLWCHVDAAYAGSAFICPEFRHWLNGVDDVNSIAFNPSKWLMVHFDCTAMWVKNSSALHGAFNVNPLYLTHEYSGLAIDFMGVYLAEKFESFVRGDSRFEIPAKRYLGLVVFRLVGENVITETLWKKLNSRGKIHCVPANLKGKYVIRFTVTSPRTTPDDIITDWKEIVGVANEVLTGEKENVKREKIPLRETKERNENFGSSLLLSNVPMSPKIVNASFAAIYDQSDVLEQFSKTIKLRKDAQDSPAMRRRIRGILMSGKQFSLDSRLDLFHGIDTSNGKTNLTIVEDSNEAEGKSNSSPENGSSLHSPIKELLDLPQTGRQFRSKSVDHEANFSIDSSCVEVEKICAKCGHQLCNLKDAKN